MASEQIVREENTQFVQNLVCENKKSAELHRSFADFAILW